MQLFINQDFFISIYFSRCYQPCWKVMIILSGLFLNGFKICSKQNLVEPKPTIVEKSINHQSRFETNEQLYY